MNELFGDDYLEEDNEMLQISKSSEKHEAIQQLDVTRKTKTIEERKKEAKCIRKRQAQITHYSLEPTYIIPNTIKLIPKEEQPIAPTIESVIGSSVIEIEIQLDEEEQSIIEEEIVTTNEDRQLSNRAKKRKKWVENIGKIRNPE